MINLIFFIYLSYTKPHSNESILEEYGNRIKENMVNIQSIRRKSSEESQIIENSPSRKTSMSNSQLKKDDSIPRNSDSQTSSRRNSRRMLDLVGETHSVEEKNSDDDSLVITSSRRKQSKNSDKLDNSQSIAANKSIIRSENNSPQSPNKKRVSIDFSIKTDNDDEDHEWAKDDDKSKSSNNSDDERNYSDGSEYEENSGHVFDKSKNSSNQYRKSSRTHEEEEEEDEDDGKRTPPKPAPRKFDADINLRNPYISDDDED